jgi:NAD(P)-dependent dehydrogenase (short-subunit alcohol dehydrogenase family)
MSTSQNHRSSFLIAIQQREKIMSNQHLHVVIGAGGGAGNAVVRVLVAQGKRVRAVGRHPLTSRPAAVESRRAGCGGQAGFLG